MSSTYETAFFFVMSSSDLWTEFKKHMFPRKQSNSFDDYRSGDIAAYYGYLSIIQHNTKLLFTIDAMDFAAENGHLDVVKW